jgi:hypothetical protein
MAGSRWFAEIPITMSLELESPRDLIVLARAVARTVARATARLADAARAAAAGCAQWPCVSYGASGGEMCAVVTEPGQAGQGQGPAVG